jgi:hypothetical protein
LVVAALFSAVLGIAFSVVVFVDVMLQMALWSNGFRPG